MAMVAFATSVSLAHLKGTFDWRKHTYEVLLSVQALLGNLTDIQRGMHGYVVNGEVGALGPFKNGIDNAPKQLAELKALTRDNLSQIPRLAKVGTELTEVLAYAQALGNDRDSRAIDAAIHQESLGDEWVAIDRTRADLEAVSAEERLLLVEDEVRLEGVAREQKDREKAKRNDGERERRVFAQEVVA